MRLEAETLVTGGTGFLGRYLLSKLAAADTVLLGRRRLEGWPHVEADLGTPESIPEGLRFDRVFHVAGHAHRRPRTEEEKRAFYTVNLDATQRLLHVLSPKPPRQFLLISTVAVYGRSRGELLNETTTRDAQDPYGDSKKQAEDAVLAWAQTHGVTASIIRLPLVAGRGAPGNLAAMIGAMRKGWYVGISPNEARRSMVWADDVAAALPSIATRGGTYHLTDGEHPRIAELEAGLARVLGRGGVLKVPRFAARFAGELGQTAESISGKRLPVNRVLLDKLMATLTFSDLKARGEIAWRPSPVLSHLDEMVAS